MTIIDPAHRAVFDEALRVCPGVLACRERGDREGSEYLISGVMATADAHGIAPCGAWSIMFSACLHWYMQATHALASQTGRDLSDVVGEMTTLAAFWESSNAE